MSEPTASMTEPANDLTDGRTRDYVLPLAWYAGIVVWTIFLMAHVPLILVSTLAVGPLVPIAALLERWNPERPEYNRLELPVWTEAAHFFLNYQLGYAVAIIGCEALRMVPRNILWPADWPWVLQIILGLLVGEAVSYWVHRLAHRLPLLWRFHALHHSGAHLNLLRAGRFHFVDTWAGTFFTLAPLAVLGAPEEVLTWVIVLSGALGVLQHSNIRMRTMGWMDGLLCTPAVHRSHHSTNVAESTRNFGTVFMLVDRLFGTYRAPPAQGPSEVGIVDDPVPRSFWGQVLGPFRRDQ